MDFSDDDGAGTLFGVGFAVALAIYCLASGFLALTALTAAGCLGALGLGCLVDWMRGRPAGDSPPGWAVKSSLAAFGTGTGFLVLELALALLASMGAREPGGPPRWLTDLAFPPECRKRPAQMPGARGSYYWQGKLHLRNQDGFRVAGHHDLGEKTFRIIAVGDGFTYGYGVDAEEAYPAVLERTLGVRGRVKVYNLGLPGSNSSDYVEVAARSVGPLQPDLVILGLCLDDFGEARAGRPAELPWALPAPSMLLTPFAEATRAGRLWTREYGRALQLVGLRDDLLTEVQRDFGARHARFRRDLEKFNRLSCDLCGMPAIVQVLDESPQEFDSDRSRLARVAEQAARDAQMDLVPSEPFRLSHSGGREALTVSGWEGHPNAFTHGAWGEAFADAVKEHPKFWHWLTEQ